MEYMITAGGSKYWLPPNGKLHRIDGPSIEYTDGGKAWHLNGKLMDFQAWKIEVRQYYGSQEDYLLMLLKL